MAMQNLSKGFHTANNLIFHERKHTAEKLFQCEPCQKYYISPYSLKRHEKKNHINTKIVA